MPKCILMKSKNVKDKEIIQNASKNKREKNLTQKNQTYIILFGSKLEIRI